jgi:hypothetical protein
MSLTSIVVAIEEQQYEMKNFWMKFSDESAARLVVPLGRYGGSTK